METGLSNAPPESLGFDDESGADNRQGDGDNEGNQTYTPSRTEIESGVHQLETLLQATVDKNFDKLEIYVLRNILSVPEDLAPWMRLSHYDVCLTTDEATLCKENIF